MTRKEAIKILSREKGCVQQALQRCADGSGYVSPDGMIRAVDYVEACSVALAALRAQQEQEDPKPLTLDELRKMDNCPVYVRHGDGREGWVILVWEYEVALLYGPDWDESPAGEPDVDFYDLRYAADPHGHFGLHSLGWLAYRHKPKEEA